MIQSFGFFLFFIDVSLFLFLIFFISDEEVFNDIFFWNNGLAVIFFPVVSFKNRFDINFIDFSFNYLFSLSRLEFSAIVNQQDTKINFIFIWGFVNQFFFFFSLLSSFFVFLFSFLISNESIFDFFHEFNSLYKFALFIIFILLLAVLFFEGFFISF